jgi:hypothetical protein
MIYMKKVIAVFSFLILSMPFIGTAHPGHGESGGFTITHYFTEPLHMIVSVSLLIAVVVYIRYLGRNRQQKENS